MTLTQPIPTELSFEPVNLCNARCFCCPYTILSENKEYTKKQMSTAQIERLITEFGELVQQYQLKPLTASVQPWRYSDPLVCRNLEYICELSKQYELSLQLTTNGVSFTDSQCRMLSKYLDIIPQIYVSIIGYNKQEVQEWMGVNLDVTLQRLRSMKEKYPELSKKLVVGLKHKTAWPKKSLYVKVLDQIRQVTLGRVKVKKGWLENRLVSNRLSTDGINFTVNEKNFINGCRMNNGKILRRLEIMVDGRAVLCCDDATGQTNYGNVFDIGITEVWKNLTQAHELIYSPFYSESKKNLICNSCSRGCTDWNKEHTQAMIRDL